MTPEEVVHELACLPDPTLPVDHPVHLAMRIHLGKLLCAKFETPPEMEANFLAAGLWVPPVVFTGLSLKGEPRSGAGDLALLLEGMVGAGWLTAKVEFKVPTAIVSEDFAADVVAHTQSARVWTDEVPPRPDARNSWKRLLDAKVLLPTGESRPSTNKAQKGRRVQRYGWNPEKLDCFEIMYECGPMNNPPVVPRRARDRKPCAGFLGWLLESRTVAKIASMYHVTPYYAQKWVSDLPVKPLPPKICYS